MEPTSIPEFPLQARVGVPPVWALEAAQEVWAAEGVVVACLQEVGMGLGRTYTAQDRAPLRDRQLGHLLREVVGAGIAVGPTTLTHPGHAPDPQLLDGEGAAAATTSTMTDAAATVVAATVATVIGVDLTAAADERRHPARQDKVYIRI